MGDSGQSKIGLELVRKLRKLIPVGLLDARKILEETKGDIEKSRSVFIQIEIEKLCKQTGESIELVGKLFFEEDYDAIRTLDRIEDVIFDRTFDSKNFQSTKHDLNMVDAWLLTVQGHGLMNSLQTADFDSIVLVVKELGFPEFAKELHIANLHLARKEEEFRELGEDELIQAVNDLKASEEYQKILESFKLNVMLNPDFFKILKRLQKNILRN